MADQLSKSASSLHQGSYRASLERAAPWLMIAPATTLIFLIFGIPALYMLRMSFNLKVDARLYETASSLDNYREVVTNPVFLSAMANTVELAFLASIATTLLAYGFSLLIWLKPGRWRMLLIALAVLPLLISEVSVITGWGMFFARTGLLSHTLMSMGILTQPVGLIFTEFAALVGLIYISFPWAVFVLVSNFDSLDKGLLEASSDLGAGALRTAREILLPLTWHSTVVAFSLNFIFAMGTFATPAALGPDTLWTLGNEVQGQALGKHNWPLASALAVVMVILIAIVLVAVRLVNLEGNWKRVGNN